MRTVVNRTAAAFPISYCSELKHYTNQGLHTGTLGRSACVMESHSIPPNAAFTFDETQKNGATLLALLAPLGA